MRVLNACRNANGGPRIIDTDLKPACGAGGAGEIALAWNQRPAGPAGGRIASAMRAPSSSSPGRGDPCRRDDDPAAAHRDGGLAVDHDP